MSRRAWLLALSPVPAVGALLIGLFGFLWWPLSAGVALWPTFLLLSLGLLIAGLLTTDPAAVERRLQAIEAHKRMLRENERYRREQYRLQWAHDLAWGLIPAAIVVPATLWALRRTAGMWFMILPFYPFALGLMAGAIGFMFFNLFSESAHNKRHFILHPLMPEGPPSPEPAPPPPADPFALASVEKGGARFAWPPEWLGGYTRAGNAWALLRTPSTLGAPLGALRAGDHRDGDTRSGVVCAQGEGHRVVVGPPGSGKFTSVIAPLLLSADDASVVVFDVKNGEAASVTAAHRAKFGPVLLLDPFGQARVPGVPAGALNPLDVLKPGAPDLLETARRLADAIFIVSGDRGADEYWNDQARDLLIALLIHVATSPLEEKTRTLRRLRQIIRRPLFGPMGDEPMAPCEELCAMELNNAADGMVADTARNIISGMKMGSAKSVHSVQQTLRANTSFLDLPSVQAVTERTTMKLETLRREVASLYVVVPEHQLATVGRWLRLVYAQIMEKARADVPRDVRAPLHLVIDEFPALGRFPRVLQDMALVRSYGVHVHVVVQTLMQLREIYGEGWQSFMGAARYQQVLGANDQFTAEYVSKRLGVTTRPQTSESQGSTAQGFTSSKSSSWTGQPLLQPHEVSSMDPARCLVLVEGGNPLQLRKWHYYAHAFLKKRAA